MKLLLVGNHTCGNRGDGAILRGLLTSLRATDSTLEIDAITRYPISSSYLLGETLYPDTLHQYHQKKSGKIWKIWKVFSRKAIPHLLHLTVMKKWRGWLPKHIQTHIDSLQQYDAVIQVGGSFFVDLYREVQFEHSLCALIANKPVYLLGHSVGPFQHAGFNTIAKTVFEKAKLVSLREPVSLALMEEAKIPVSQVHKGADTAWLVNTEHVDIPVHLLEQVSRKPTVAITLRDLAPFDKRLGVTQQAYEEAFAVMVDEVILAGYQVMALSTCTGIESYHKDDRMIALKVGNKVKNNQDYSVVMDELNDVQLGTLLSHCQLTIGTRLHSAIISMNFNTPAIALNYEHKSEGIMQQLSLPQYSKPISSLFDGSLKQEVFSALNDIEQQKIIVQECVIKERARVTDMVAFTLNNINAN